MRALLLVLLLGVRNPSAARSEFDRARAEALETVTASYVQDGVCSRPSVWISACREFRAIFESDGYQTHSAWFDGKGTRIGRESSGCGVSEVEGSVPSCDSPLKSTEDVCAIVRKRLQRVGVTLQLGDESLRETRHFVHSDEKLKVAGAVFLVRFDSDPEAESFLDVVEVDAKARVTRSDVLGDNAYPLAPGDRVSLPVELKRDNKLVTRIFSRSVFAPKDAK